MDILKMLADLRTEREQIEQAILVIERLAVGSGGKRRGRPPKWMSEANAESATGNKATGGPRKSRVVSAAGRRRMAEAQKKRWADKKAEAAPHPE